MQTDQLISGWIYDIINKEADKSKDIILEKVEEIIDEHNAYLAFKKENKFMKTVPNMKYMDDYYDKLDSVDKPPKEMYIKNLIENHFKRWLKIKQGTEFLFTNYKGRSMPTNTFRSFLQKDKDYLIEDGRVINLVEMWKDCNEKKYKFRTNSGEWKYFETKDAMDEEISHMSSMMDC